MAKRSDAVGAASAADADAGEGDEEEGDAVDWKEVELNSWEDVAWLSDEGP